MIAEWCPVEQFKGFAPWSVVLTEEIAVSDEELRNVRARFDEFSTQLHVRIMENML